MVVRDLNGSTNLTKNAKNRTQIQSSDRNRNTAGRTLVAKEKQQDSDAAPLMPKALTVSLLAFD